MVAYFNRKVCSFCNQKYQDYGTHITEEHPITCTEVRDRFPDYTDGKLDDETDERVICHLAKCKVCMNALAQWNQGQLLRLRREQHRN